MCSLETLAEVAASRVARTPPTTTPMNSACLSCERRRLTKPCFVRRLDNQHASQRFASAKPSPATMAWANQRSPDRTRRWFREHPRHGLRTETPGIAREDGEPAGGCSARHGRLELLLQGALPGQMSPRPGASAMPKALCWPGRRRFASMMSTLVHTRKGDPEVAGHSRGTCFRHSSEHQKRFKHRCAIRLTSGARI